MEIYNEVVKDLLNPIGKALNIRESSEKGIYVEGLFELVSTCIHCLQNILFIK